MDLTLTGGPTDLALIAACVTLALVAVWTDIRRGKIFNAVTVPFAVLGLTLNTIGGGLDGALMSLGGVAAGFGLWFATRLLGRIIGGGDIKLLMAFGAIMGPAFMLWTFLVGAIIGGVIAVIVSLRHGILQQAFRQVAASLYMRAKMSTPLEITPDSRATSLPYAVALSSGALIMVGTRIWG
ncbi:MAG: A24 family peptidase [Armatimonadota bacterium]